ncbi:MAG: hypothetical protein PVF58_06690 [Candidatus Methanofastidiosia archaeon]|jgi:thiol-disulfide isomerase/thioredoxin
MAHNPPVTYTHTRTRRKEKNVSDTEPEESAYTITGTAVARFILVFIIVYCVAAVSIFSVFALQDQVPHIVYQNVQHHVEPGEEATFAFIVKNPSILEKKVEITLHKELPEGWVASFCSDTQCFYDTGGFTLHSLQEKRFTANVITDASGKTGKVNVSLIVNGETKDTVEFTVNTSQNAAFNAQVTHTERVQDEVSFTVLLKNSGNVSDVYTMFVPPGVTASVSSDTVELNPGEETEIIIYISQKESVNTSVMVTSQTGVSKTLYLICEQKVHYDFELYSAREFYMDTEKTEISFDIINIGDTADTYTVQTTCLASDWESICSTHTVNLQPNTSERVKIQVNRGTGKSTSIIVTAASQTGLSKNIKLKVYAQETQGKTVLAEYFTGTWCYVCSYGERALRQLAEEIDNLIVLVYHLKDDIETPGSKKRSEGVYGFVDTVSTLVINGSKHVYYSSGGEGAIYFKYKNVIEKMLSEELKAEIYVSGQIIENTAYITAEIRSYCSGDYDVYFVLFKNDFNYKGGVKQYIVRDVSGPESVTLTGNTVVVSGEFVLPDIPEGYGVVIIIQNPVTLEVIQATSYML